MSKPTTSMFPLSVVNAMPDPVLETLLEASKPSTLVSKSAQQKAPAHGNLGLTFSRCFTTDGVSPFDQVQWERRNAVIQDFKGKTIFEQKDVEVPADWSLTATNIVASKYLHGKVGTAERESGVRNLITRVVDTISMWGVVGGYFLGKESATVFAMELAHLLLNQKVAFNSPVWFNVGCDRLEPAAEARNWHWNDDNGIQFESVGYSRPQCSACFINSVQDSMESIMELARTEAMLFKFGSGCTSGASSVYLQDQGFLPLVRVWDQYVPGRPVIEFDSKGRFIDVADAGIRTLSLNKDTCSYELQQITHLWKYEVDANDKLTVRFDTGTSVTVSIWHPFQVWDGSKITEKRADCLSDGDLVIGTGPSTSEAIPVISRDLSYQITHHKKTKTVSTVLDEDLAWLCAYFIGDGSLGSHVHQTTNKYGRKYSYDRHRVRFFDETVECLEKVQRIILAKFGERAVIQNDGRGSNGKHLGKLCAGH